MAFTMGEKIRILLKRKKKTIKELAELLDTTSQNFSNKLTRDNFSEQELVQIATALDCRFEGYFILENNERI